MQQMTVREVIAALFGIAAALAWVSPVSADPIIGPITHIRDADTFVIGNQPIRLCGIDAPERDQPGGGDATTYLHELTDGKALRCVPVTEGTVCDGRSKRTNGDRIVAQCFLQGRDLATMLVTAKHACDWPRFSGGHYRIAGGCSK